MIQLSADQANAVASFEAFSTDPNQTIFALLGYAGTGKTFTYGQMALQMNGQVVMATPTHKATNVVRRNLAASGVPFEEGYDRQNHVSGRMITGTTAQLLGLAPVISDNQTEDKREFGKTSSGILGQGNMLGIKWVVIDEVSMLSAEHLLLIEAACIEAGAKLLIIGDPGQLPPVNADPIAWGDLPAVAELRQIMRQASDSAIPHLAQAVRTGGAWRSVMGAGVTHELAVGKAFLDQVEVPSETEAERSVFVAYTNKVVNEIQDLACREVYGHGRNQFEPGQIVISDGRIEAEVMTYIPKYGRSYPRNAVAANNADELRVLSFGGKGEYGTLVELERVNKPGSFPAEYLTPEDQANRNHPYNVEVKARFAEANALQASFNKDRSNYNLDERRKAAWSRAFDLKDRTVLSFRHPFAITSHRSQGSTYKRVFVDAGDIERFENAAQSLYVAATRPSEELVIG